MISNDTFKMEWLISVNKKLGWNRQETQLKNLEKSTAALYLVECLRKEKIDFIFKGGTSLLLLLNQIYRLSIDIDVIIERPLKNGEDIFATICNSGGIFYRFEKQERDIDSIFDTSHYKFFYRSYAADNEESYILLDLYCMVNPYEKTQEVEIVSKLLYTKGENLTVIVPNIDCILGDKLTALAPNTIGIPLTAESGKRPKRVEVLKQMFDIGNLFDLCENLEEIRKTYITVAKHEISKMQLKIQFHDVLDDTLQFAFIIGHAGNIEKEEYEVISKGFKEFNKFVSDLSFDANKAILCAAKIAYIVQLLKANASTPIEHYDDTMDMTNWEIKGKKFKTFNNYKLSNPQSFFYWYKAINKEF